jgi:hypothetical protein
MQESCRRYRDLLNRDPFEELTPEERRDLDTHVTRCRDCAREQHSLTETLEAMGSVEEAPIPRHFFVYEERRSSPWRVFRRLSPVWQGALGAAVVAGLVLVALTATRLHLRWEAGVLLASFGDAPRERLASAWKDELLTTAEARSRAADLEWMARIRRELARSREEQSDQVKTLLASGLRDIEGRVDLQAAAGAHRAESDIRLALFRFRQLVSDQRQRDLANVGRQLDGFATRNQIQSERTDLLMTAMFGPAELSKQ